MNKIKNTIIFLLFSLFLTYNISAQCPGIVYETSLTWETSSSVHGYSSTELDYCAGLYYDPATSGTFSESYGTFYAFLGSGYSQGSANWVPAEVYYSYNSPVSNVNYTTFSDHYVIAYYQVYVEYWGGGWYWYDPWMLGYGEVGGGYDYFYGPGYYGGGYSYYWVSAPQYVGSTMDTLNFQGNGQPPSECQLGQQFSPSGVPCPSQCPPGQQFASNGTPCPLPPLPPLSTLTIHIKDKFGNNIEGTTQNAMLGVPVRLSVTVEEGSQGISYIWIPGSGSESDNTNLNQIRISWNEVGQKTVRVNVLKGLEMVGKTVTINVLPPTMTNLSAVERPPKVNNLDVTSQGLCATDYTSPNLSLGCWSDSDPDIQGIKISGSASIPAGDISDSDQGKIYFKQIVNPFRRRVKNNVAECLTRRNNQSTLTHWLYDQSTPEQSYQTGHGEQNFTSPNASIFILDTPTINTEDITEAYAEDIFESYLVYEGTSVHQNKVGKVLGMLPWNWKAKSQGTSMNHTLIDSFSFPPSNPATPITINGGSSFVLRDYNGVVGSLRFELCETPTQLNSQPWGDDVPTQVQAGSNFVVYITMRNTGQMAWNGNSGFRFKPINSNWTTYIQHITQDVFPGTDKTFDNILIEAPLTPGTYLFEWQMHYTLNGVEVPFGQVFQKSIQVVGQSGPGGPGDCDLNSPEATYCQWWGGWFNTQTCLCENLY